jgi:hypothetical protein
MSDELIVELPVVAQIVGMEIITASMSVRDMREACNGLQAEAVRPHWEPYERACLAHLYAALDDVADEKERELWALHR